MSKRCLLWTLFLLPSPWGLWFDLLRSIEIRICFRWRSPAFVGRPPHTPDILRGRGTHYFFSFNLDRTLSLDTCVFILSTKCITSIFCISYPGSSCWNHLVTLLHSTGHRWVVSNRFRKIIYCWLNYRIIRCKVKIL